MPARISIEEINSLAAEKDGRCLSKEYTNQFIKLTWQCKKGHVFDYTIKSVRKGAWCNQCSHGNKKETALELMQEWAGKHNGKCLSDKYINSASPLLWQCKDGHTFKASRDRIKSGSWCTECNKIKFRNKKLKQIQTVAQKHNGKCLSEKYITDETKLEFECSKGHKWKATPHIIIYDKSWCPHCYGRVKHNIEYMQELAQKHNGKCLSKEYVNSNAKLEWECSKGHRWWTTPFTIINDGSWCPYCSKRVKYTIEMMQEFAKKNGGKCLSTEYINNRTPLKWQCKKNHTWEVSARSILDGHWCQKCYFDRKKYRN